MMKAGGVGRNSTNLEHLGYEQRFGPVRPLSQVDVSENESLFTNPTLMKTIKDDLARIDNTKNMRNLQNLNSKENIYFK
jgi:hypothetical protein